MPKLNLSKYLKGWHGLEKFLDAVVEISPHDAANSHK